jgi:uncharacterized membrane protein
MAVIEHHIDVHLPVPEAIEAWGEYPFRSPVGRLRTPGHHATWRAADGSETSGSVLFLSLGPRLTRVTVKIDYFAGANGVAAATLNAHVFADVTMYRRFTETVAARSDERDRVAG